MKTLLRIICVLMLNAASAQDDQAQLMLRVFGNDLGLNYEVPLFEADQEFQRQPSVCWNRPSKAPEARRGIVRSGPGKRLQTRLINAQRVEKPRGP